MSSIEICRQITAIQSQEVRAPFDGQGDPHTIVGWFCLVMLIVVVAGLCF